MNNAIDKFYLDGIDSKDITEDFIREALITGIRCDNTDLVRKATEKNSYTEVSMAILLRWNLQLRKWLQMK